MTIISQINAVDINSQKLSSAQTEITLNTNNPQTFNDYFALINAYLSGAQIQNFLPNA